MVSSLLQEISGCSAASQLVGRLDGGPMVRDYDA